MRKILIMALGILAVSLSAFPQTEGDHNRIIHGFSASYLSLPFERYSSSISMEKELKTYQGNGWGINYDLSIPLFCPRIRLMTGMGFSHVLYMNDTNVPYYFKASDMGFTSDFYSNEYDDTYNLIQRCIEYMYLSVPVNIGYRLIDNKGLSVTPYLGITMKYNLSFVEKIQNESNSWLDGYINVFDDSLYKSDAKRFLFQYDLGVELGYRHIYGFVRYEKDFSQLYNELLYSYEYFLLFGLTEFEKMHDWRFGVGFRF